MPYKPPTSRPASIGFDGMAEPQVVQLLVGGDHVRVQPGVGSRAARRRAGADGGGEGMIDPRGEWAIAQGLAQAARQLNSSGNSTMRGSGDHHRIGCCAEYQGNTPRS